LLAGPGLGKHRVAVGGDLHDQDWRLRLAGPVLRVRLEDGVLVWLKLLQLVRSGVDGFGGVLALEQLGRRDAAPEVLRVRLADPREVGVERAGLEDELGGQGVGRLDLVDLADQRAVDQGKLGRALELEGERDVGGGQRRAVLPDQPVPQTVGDPEPPGRAVSLEAGTAVRQCGHLAGEPRDQGAIGVRHHQPVTGQRVDLAEVTPAVRDAPEEARRQCELGGGEELDALAGGWSGLGKGRRRGRRAGGLGGRLRGGGRLGRRLGGWRWRRGRWCWWLLAAGEGQACAEPRDERQPAPPAEP
jgi:hypothetical protein